MTRTHAFSLLALFVTGQAMAQQVPWPSPVMPYVPFWGAPALAQPAQPLTLPPGFLPPQSVPFPMPFWYWYVPPPGVFPAPAVQPMPAPKVEARPEVKADPEPPLPEKGVPAPAVLETPSSVPEPAAKAPEAPVAEQAAVPLPRVEPKPEAVTTAKAPAKSSAVPAKKAAQAKKAAPAKVDGAKKGPPQTPVAASKPVRQARKLCWKEGRLDVCE